MVSSPQNVCGEGSYMTQKSIKRQVPETFNMAQKSINVNIRPLNQLPVSNTSLDSFGRLQIRCLPELSSRL